MIVGIHQPNYLPYLGFFDKMAKSDIFIIYDDAQFNKYEFQHRNRIRIYDGWKWLTVPVIKEEICIKDINVMNMQPKNNCTIVLLITTQLSFFDQILITATFD